MCISVVTDATALRFKLGSGSRYAGIGNASSEQEGHSIAESLVLSPYGISNRDGWKPLEEDEEPWIEYTSYEIGPMLAGLVFYACPDGSYIIMYQISCVYENSTEVFYINEITDTELFSLTPQLNTSIVDPIYVEYLQLRFCPTVRVYPKTWHVHICVKWRPEFIFGKNFILTIKYDSIFNYAISRTSALLGYM